MDHVARMSILHLPIQYSSQDSWPGQAGATKGLNPFRRVKATPAPNTFEKHRSPFPSRYFSKSMTSSWQKVIFSPPICTTVRLPLVLRYFCGSIRVRGRWNTPKSKLKAINGLPSDWLPHGSTQAGMMQVVFGSNTAARADILLHRVLDLPMRNVAPRIESPQLCISPPMSQLHLFSSPAKLSRLEKKWEKRRQSTGVPSKGSEHWCRHRI